MPYWNGQEYILPGAYSQVDAEALQGVGLSAMSNIGMFGACEGGVPEHIYEFTDSVDAKGILRSGALLKAVQLAFSNGASRIFACRAGNPTRAHITLASSAPADLLTLTSYDYGDQANEIQAKVEAGTNSGKKITLKIPADNIYKGRTGYIYETYDDLASVAAAVTAINAGSSVVSASLVLEGTLAAAAYAPLANGTDDNAPSAGECETVIDLFLEQEDVHVMHAAGITDAATHAYLDQHCVDAAALRRERIAVVGGASGETDDQIIARAAALNSQRTVLCGPGVYLYDDDGANTLYAPCYLAAIVAGMIVSKDVATSVTHKTFSCNALETKFTVAEQEGLLRGGVCIAEQARVGGATIRRIVQGVTTYVTDDKWEEITTVRIADFVAKNMRENLELKYVGQKASLFTLNAMKEDIVTLLQDMLSVQDPEQAVISGYRSLSVSADSQDPRIVVVSFEASPIFTMTWIFISIKLRPVTTPLTA